MVASGPKNHVKLIKDDVNEDGHIDDDGQRVEKMQIAVRRLLECIGEDVSREGLIDTPKVLLLGWISH